MLFVLQYIWWKNSYIVELRELVAMQITAIEAKTFLDIFLLRSWCRVSVKEKKSSLRTRRNDFASFCAVKLLTFSYLISNEIHAGAP